VFCFYEGIVLRAQKVSLFISVAPLENKTYDTADRCYSLSAKPVSFGDPIKMTVIAIGSNLTYQWWMGDNRTYILNSTKFTLENYNKVSKL